MSIPVKGAVNTSMTARRLQELAEKHMSWQGHAKTRWIPKRSDPGFFWLECVTCGTHCSIWNLPAADEYPDAWSLVLPERASSQPCHIHIIPCQHMVNRTALGGGHHRVHLPEESPVRSVD